MIGPDYESRIGAHSIFSVVLIPSSVSPNPAATTGQLGTSVGSIQRTLSRTVSVFSSSAALFKKLSNQHASEETPMLEEEEEDDDDEFVDPEEGTSSLPYVNRLKSTYSRFYSFDEEKISKRPSMVSRLKSRYSRGPSTRNNLTTVAEDKVISNDVDEKPEFVCLLIMLRYHIGL